MAAGRDSGTLSVMVAERLPLSIDVDAGKQLALAMAKAYACTISLALGAGLAVGLDRRRRVRHFGPQQNGGRTKAAKPPAKLSAGTELSVGAGEGNRTLVCSLGSCRSTIELRPRIALFEFLAPFWLRLLARARFAWPPSLYLVRWTIVAPNGESLILQFILE